MSRYVGVDLGGTGTRIVVLDAEGHVCADATTPTVRGAKGTEAVAVLIDSVGSVVDSPIAGIGIGASGPVDSSGIIRNPATLPAYSGTPIAAIMADRFGVPCHIENDAVTAALGEHRYGARAGSAAMLMVTLGTGIGVTMLVRGDPYRAADGSHPELGHLSVNGPAVQCYCGLTTCWEQLASRTALEALAGGDPEEIARAARVGDADARALFETFGARVGVGLATLFSMFRPDDVVIGGSVAQYLDLYGTAMRPQLQRSAEFACEPVIVASKLGNLAGAVGAAAMMFPSSSRSSRADT